MNILDLIIDSEKTVGKKLLITDVRPYYSYDGNQRLDKIAGYRYEVTLPERKFEKLSVKIAGNQRIALEDNQDYMPVVFEELQLKLYRTPSGYNIAATASNIKVDKRE